MVATVNTGDCLAWLRSMQDNSVDSIVTDPPYGLSNIKPQRITEAITAWATGDRESVPDGRGFMGHDWDKFVPPPAVWDECLRVLKPGGHLVAFAGSRTHDLMGLSIRMAGFEIRDSLAWLHSQGFPKSMNVSKAIDKAAGALEHESVRFTVAGRTDKNLPNPVVKGYTPPAPATPEAEQWQGWGTALKPAFEPVTLARKPLEGTVVANVLKWGTGALNIDGCRIGDEVRVNPAGTPITEPLTHGKRNGGREQVVTGRWPANVALDEDQAAALDEQSGTLTSGKAGKGGHTRNATSRKGIYGNGKGLWQEAGSAGELYGDSGGASRFFYCAKASKKERPVVDGVSHPTVKPLSLMRWLVRLVTPEGGLIVNPFAGSGTAIEAAMLEGFDVTGCEREPRYIPLIEQRIERASNSLSLDI